jgi:CubicO group peptidase (beta-lactamase class C family)
MVGLLTGALLLANQAGTPPDLRPEAIRSWTDGFMETSLRQAQIAGAVVVIVRGDRVVFAQGYGYADVEKKTPVDADRTGFRPGSVSKLFTATAVMQLVEQGKLDLDHDVNEYLDFRVRSADGSPITVRQLLTHSAGFVQLLKALGYVDSSLVVPLDDYVKRFRPPAVYRPGTTPAYSNYSLVLAGYLVQRISGERFEDYIDAHIFKPLGMTRSTFRQPLPPAFQADMSRGYLQSGGPTQPFEILGTMPAGGATTTGTDMARFMIAHLRNGQVDGIAIIRPETVALMHTFAQSPPAPPGFGGMALGFMVGDNPARRTLSHGGDTNAFHAGLTLFPDAGIGVYVAVNSLGSGVLDGNDLVHTYIGAFGNRFLPVSAEPTPSAVATASAHAALTAGRYLSSRHFERSFLSLLNLRQETIRANPDGTITIPSVADRDGNPKMWREVAPWTWQELSGPDRLIITVDQGQVTMIRRSGDAPNVLVRATGPRTAPWNVPLLWLSIVVLPAEGLRRLVQAIRKRRRPSATPARSLDRAAQIGTLAVALTIAGWLLVFKQLMSGDVGLISGTRDLTLRLLQAGGVLAVALSPATAIARLRETGGLLSKAWSGLVLVALAGFVWIAFAFWLMGPSLTY